MLKFNLDKLLRLTLLLFIGLLFLPQHGQAQKSINKLKTEGDDFFKVGDYRQALNYYTRYNQYKSDVRIVRKRLAICQFFNNQVDKARENLELLMEGNQLMHDAEIYFYHAECLAHQHEFESAAKSYKIYASKVRSKQEKKIVYHKLKNCAAGIDLSYSEPIGVLNNAGPLVNSIEDDIAPLFSKNFAQRFYFASNFDRNEANPLNAKTSLDIYSTEIKEGDWGNPILFPTKFSSSLDEIPLGFFNDGKVMYFQRGRRAESTILIDTFSGDSASLQSKDFTVSDMPIFPELGDQNVHNYGDGLVLFSSKRPGGLGGYDLYYTQRIDDGWSIPKNLGARINSPFDEVDPFLTNNGASLYFSSNRESSIGGFDIFKTRFAPEINDWAPSINMGFPINSAADDRGVQLSSTNNSIIFYSNRKTGYGGYDIFILYAKAFIGDMDGMNGLLKPGFLQSSQLTESTVISTDASPTSKIIVENITEKPADIALSIDSIMPVTTQIRDEITELNIPRIQVDPVLYPEKSEKIYSIYYSKNDEVLNPQSINQLNKLADLLRRYPKLKITFYSHAPASKGLGYVDLYLSARRAEQAVNYMSDINVSKDVMSILSLGNQFPYADKSINDQLSGYSNKLNRRIDAVISGGEHYNLTFDHFDSGLEKDDIDKRQQKLTQLTNGISFKVQVKESGQIYKDKVLKENDYPSIEKVPGKSNYLYTVGWSQDFAAIDFLAKRLIAQGYKNAKIITYYNGDRLDDERAKLIAGRHTQLGLYLARISQK